MSLSSININSVSEVIGDGINAAMNALEAILSNKISTKCGESVVKTVQSADFAVMQPAMYFNIAFSGDITGKAVAVFRKIDLSVILQFLMNNDKIEAEFDEMGLGMIKEIMAQTSAEFARKLADFFGGEITATISGLMEFSGNSIISAAFSCDENTDILTQSFQYEIGSVLKGKGIFTFNDNFANSISNLCDDSRPRTSVSSDTPDNSSLQQSKASKFDSANINVSPTSFPKFSSEKSTGQPLLGSNVDLLMDVPMNVCVEIGKTKRKMRDIMNFTQGTVIPIDKQVGAPVDITVNGQLIARGDVIVVDDNFGVRITELVNSDNSPVR